MRFGRVALLGVVMALFVAGCGSEGNVFSLEVGDCFGSLEGESISDVELIDCSEPHENEVFAVWDVAGDTLPDVAEFGEGCTDRFEDAIGTAYTDSLFYSLAIYPSEESFEQGDKEVVCYGLEIDENDEPIARTGSILGSGK